jgi:hypothetical protein
MVNIAIAATLLATYILTLCVFQRRIPNSVSQTVFLFPDAGKWLWTVVVAAVAFLTMPTFIDRTAESVQFLAFFACAGLLVVAVCPLVAKNGDATTYKDAPTYRIHLAGAYTSAIASQTVVAFCQPWLLLLWLPWFAAFVWISKDTHWRTSPFWAEITAFTINIIYCII